MKLNYFYNIMGGPQDSILEKVLGQCRSLIKSGMDVHLILVGNQIDESTNTEIITTKKLFEKNCSNVSNILFRIQRQYEVRKIFIEIIESATLSDIVYVRYPYPLFYLLWPFSRAKKRCKIIIEHNTIEINEFALGRLYLSLFIELVVGKFARSRADAIVGVTNEITSYELMRSGDLKKPHVTMGNGIEVNKIKLRKPPDFRGQELRLLCVASFSRWHGIDRLLRGLALYGGNKKVLLYIIGKGPEMPNLRKIVKDLKLTDNVIFTGILGGSFLDDYFDTCHIAIGSLGIHRMDMKEASILKAREYCARGIPFLYGCSDPDFPDVFPFIKGVPGDESPIDVEEIISFVKEVYSDPEHHIKMRTYAEGNLDWSVKMEKLKEFCESLIDG